VNFKLSLLQKITRLPKPVFCTDVDNIVTKIRIYSNKSASFVIRKFSKFTITTSASFVVLNLHFIYNDFTILLFNNLYYSIIITIVE